MNGLGSTLIRTGLQWLLPQPPSPRPSGDRLAAPDGPELVRQARAQSVVLPVLRDRLATLFRDRRCVIIGSAPKAALPLRQSGDRFLCANGSVHAAGALGVPEPDLTAITGFATHPKLVNHLDNRSAWRGRKTKELVFVANGDTEANARKLFAETGFTYGGFTTLSPWERAAIILEATGLDLGLGPRDERMSMGAFAATLAIWGGAAEIVLCGISLHGGHAHLPDDTPRHHVPGDSRFFKHLLTLPLRVRTTSADVQQRFGIPATD
jgi:hypothetical protein